MSRDAEEEESVQRFPMLFARKRRVCVCEDPRARRAPPPRAPPVSGARRGRSARGRARTRPGGRSRGAAFGVARDSLRREGGGCRRSVFRRACFRNLFVGPLPFVVRAAVRVPLAPPPFPIAREFAAQTLEQLGVRVGVRGPGRGLRPRRRGRVEVFVREAPRDDRPRPCAHASSAPESSAAPDRGAAFVARGEGPTPRPRRRPRGRAPRPRRGPARAPRRSGRKNAIASGSTRATVSTSSVSALSAPVRTSRFPFAPSLASCDARPNSTETQYPNPGSRSSPARPGTSRASSRARMIDRNAATPASLTCSSSAEDSARARCRSREGGRGRRRRRGGGPGRSRASPRTSPRASSPRRRSGAPTRARAGGTRAPARAPRRRGRGRSRRRSRRGERRVRGGAVASRPPRGASRSSGARGRSRWRRRARRDPSRQPPTPPRRGTTPRPPGGGGGGGGGRLHGDRRRSAATIRKDEEGALARDPPTPSPRGAPLKTPRRARSEKTSFRVIKAGNTSCPTGCPRGPATEPRVTTDRAFRHGLGLREASARGRRGGERQNVRAWQGQGRLLLQGARGKGICEHGRQREKCKECGGSGLCEHGRERSQCKECGGSGICEHGRVRSKCKECGGSGICEHGRAEGSGRLGRSKCKSAAARICASASTGGAKGSARSAGGGSQICEHGRVRGLSNLRAREAARSAGARASASTGGSEAGARSAGLEHMRAREAAKQVQGVRGLRHLRAREAEIRVQGVPRGSRPGGSRPAPPPVHPKPEILVEPEDVEDPGRRFRGTFESRLAPLVALPGKRE